MANLTINAGHGGALSSDGRPTFNNNEVAYLSDVENAKNEINNTINNMKPILRASYNGYTLNLYYA